MPLLPNSHGLVLGLPGRALIFTLALLFTSSVALAQDEKKKKKDDAVGEESKKATSGLVALAKVLPLGQEQKSVVFPSYSGTRIASLVRAASMKRVNDKHLYLTEMSITTYDADEAEEMVVTLPTAIYDLTTGNLQSDSRSLVSRDDFDIEGDAMLFDSERQYGRMEGNVKMIIKDSSTINFGSAPKAEPSKGPTNEKEPTQ